MTPSGRSVVRALLVLCLTLPGTAMAQSFQPIARLACPDGEFIADARPFGENAAASSAVELRYRYQGVELAAIHYEGYYQNLNSYLHQGKPPVFNLGLRLDTSGNSKNTGYEQGDTLYLPPSRFSAHQAERLVGCLVENHTTLRSAFERAEIKSSTLLGLMETRTGTGRNGVARIVHADAPLAGIYGSAWLLIVVERGGHVLLHTNYTAGNTAESAVWGQVIPGTGTKPVLRAQRHLLFQGKEREGAHFLPEANARGQRLQDDYEVQWQ